MLKMFDLRQPFREVAHFLLGVQKPSFRSLWRKFTYRLQVDEMISSQEHCGENTLDRDRSDR
jgi:hypothetical protein